MKPHPHADATYEVVRLATGEFGVKVSIPDTSPTTVRSFNSEAAAEDWITLHKNRIQTHPQPRAAFRRPKPKAVG